MDRNFDGRPLLLFGCILFLCLEVLSFVYNLQRHLQRSARAVVALRQSIVYGKWKPAVLSWSCCCCCGICGAVVPTIAWNSRLWWWWGTPNSALLFVGRLSSIRRSVHDQFSHMYKNVGSSPLSLSLSLCWSGQVNWRLDSRLAHFKKVTQTCACYCEGNGGGYGALRDILVYLRVNGRLC